MVDDVIAKSDLAELNKQNQEINGEFDKNLAVKTKTGIFVGQKNKNTIFFSGIPYAKPPVKNLRWKAPEPLPESDKVFEAKYLGASAIQVDYEGSFLKNHRQSEDCLTLNICVGAKKSKQKKPVVVVIHHGDFTYCGSADPLFPGGEKYPDATNLGLLDQIAALKWIKENISAFGGNPENITVMGFESGALSISQLIACEKARNLFQKAFIFYGNPLSTYNSPEPSRNLAKKLLQETSTTNMEELLQLSTEQLKEATQKLVLNLVSGPTRDDKLIPLDIYDAYRNVSGIEFIIGIPSNERQIYKSVVGDEKYKDFISKELEDILSYLDKNYNDIAKDFRNYIEEQSEKMPEFEAKAKAYEQFYTLNTYRAAKKLAESGNKVHLLYWNVKPLTLIENLGSGTVDVAATFFGSREAVQMYGNVLNKDIAEILQNLLRKFESDDEMKLFNNEIKGIDAIDWEKFPKALIVSEKSFKCELIAEKLIEVKSLLKLLEEETFHNGNQNFI